MSFLNGKMEIFLKYVSHNHYFLVDTSWYEKRPWSLSKFLDTTLSVSNKKQHSITYNYLAINYSLSSFLCWKLSILAASNTEMEATAISDSWSFQYDSHFNITFPEGENTLFYKRAQSN